METTDPYWSEVEHFFRVYIFNRTRSIVVKKKIREEGRMLMEEKRKELKLEKNKIEEKLKIYNEELVLKPSKPEIIIQVNMGKIEINSFDDPLN